MSAKIDTLFFIINYIVDSWESGNWSDCSESCGQGMQTRPVLCKQLIDSELHLDVPTSRCDSRTRPESARSCNTRACAEWTNGEWGKVIMNINASKTVLLKVRPVCVEWGTQKMHRPSFSQIFHFFNKTGVYMNIIINDKICK